MANWRTQTLDEIEVGQDQVEELLKCLVHTILFTRAPGPVKPKVTDCENFRLTYARCGVAEVDKQVDDAIDQFITSLTPAAPELLKGKLLVSFFERRVTKSMFGLLSNEEKVIWEQWVIPVLVNITPYVDRDDPTSELERERSRQTTEVALQNAMLKILNNVQNLDHMPPVMYEFEIITYSPMSENREDVYSRVLNSPSPFREAF